MYVCVVHRKMRPHRHQSESVHEAGHNCGEPGVPPHVPVEVPGPDDLVVGGGGEEGLDLRQADQELSLIPGC